MKNMKPEAPVKNRNFSHSLITFILAACSAYALCIYAIPTFRSKNTISQNFLSTVGDVQSNFLIPMLIVLLIFWFRKILLKKYTTTAIILSIFFSLITLTGLSFSQFGDARLLTTYLLPTSFYNLYGYSTFIAFVGFGVLYYCLLQMVISTIDTYDANNTGESTSRVFIAAKRNIKSHPFLVAIIVIAICWLPYYIIYFPGGFAFDGFRQFAEYFGYIPKTTHHPYAATLLMGFLFSIGKHFSINAGLFGYTLVQSVLGCTIFAYTCRNVFVVMQRSRFNAKSSLFFVLATLFFALLPAFPLCMLYTFKDVPYFLSFLMLMNVMVLAFIQKSFSWKQIILFTLSGLGVAIFRNDGIFILVATTIVILFMITNTKWLISLITAIITTLLVIFNSFVFPAMGVQKYSTAEMLSVPLQQTARYLRDHPDDVTVSEKETLQQLLKPGRDINNLGKKYNPNLSDPVKNSFASFNSNSIKKYLKVWWSMGLRHPGTYLEATVAGTDRYFYPFHTTGGVPLSYTKENIPPNSINKMYLENGSPKADIPFVPQYSEKMVPAQKTVLKQLQRTFTIPGFALLYNCGFYTLILIICASLIIQKKKWKGLLAFVPVILILAVCLLSPVNANFRYALPYIVTTPLLISITLFELGSVKKLGKDTSKETTK